MSVSGDPSLFRSEVMERIRIVVPKQIAKEVVRQIGRTKTIQFTDLNPDRQPFKRPYATDVVFCSNLERSWGILNELVVRNEVEIPIEDFSLVHSHGSTIQELPEMFQTLTLDIGSLQANFVELRRQFMSVREHQAVLRFAAPLLGDVLAPGSPVGSGADGGRPRGLSSDFLDLEMGGLEPRSGSHSRSTSFRDDRPLLGSSSPFSDDDAQKFDDFETRESSSGEHKSSSRDDEDSIAQRRPDIALRMLRHVTGLIDESQRESFERMLWRATRGNILLRFAEIPWEMKDGETGESIQKTAFCVFFSAKKVQSIIVRLVKALRCSLYDVPETTKLQRATFRDLEMEARDLNRVVDQSHRALLSELVKVAQELPHWKRLIQKEKLIAHTLGLFDDDATHTSLVAEGWCPVRFRRKAEDALRTAQEHSRSAVVPAISVIRSAGETPPTFFVLNEFTEGFQTIIDAYGVPRYQEFNPTPFFIITFPFLFGVMFGDVGHGSIMTVFAVILILFWKQLKGKNELLDFPIVGRYIVLLMGIFSIYTGLLYSDCLSMPVKLLKSGWSDDGRTHNFVYQFGLDWRWLGSKNDIQFTNSLKMKMSIIFGVSQMTLGLFLSLLNSIHFKNMLDIFCEFVPQLIFLWSIFGYLCILIIIKWSKDWTGLYAPRLLQMIIQMLLHGGNDDVAKQLYPGQLYVEWFLLSLAFISVPWMLIAKPYILYKQNKKRGLAVAFIPLKDRFQSADDALELSSPMSMPKSEEGVGDFRMARQPSSIISSSSVGHHHGHHAVEPFDLSKVIVEQLIHTLEFVLGCVSNTASYLRLWALSLAHAQLSSVFWEYLVEKSINTDNIMFMAIGGILWFAATIAVLMIMESLSAFLHSLRLHWVEFQNKFYLGDGIQFEPLRFDTLDEE
eukprot:37490_1